MSKLENSTQQSTFILSVYLHGVYSIYRAYLDLDISMVTCPLATGTLLFILHTPLTRHIVLLDPDMWLHSGFSRVKFLLSWITNLHCYLYALDTSLYSRIFWFFECGSWGCCYFAAFRMLTHETYWTHVVSFFVSLQLSQKKLIFVPCNLLSVPSDELFI